MSPLNHLCPLVSTRGSVVHSTLAPPPPPPPSLRPSNLSLIFRGGGGNKLLLVGLSGGYSTDI